MLFSNSAVEVHDLQAYRNMERSHQGHGKKLTCEKECINETRMVVQGQLDEHTVCFSDIKACEELIHSFIRQKPNNIRLRQQRYF